MKRSCVKSVLVVVIGACLLPVTTVGRSASAQDNPCAGLTGAAAGLCKAYCSGLNCPLGHGGDACQSLLANWQRITGLPVFPCDAVCCECPTAGPMCTTARQCASEQCTVEGRCVNGQCPPPACPCFARCKDAAGSVGRCLPAGRPTGECSCHVPPPRCGLNAGTQTCGGPCPSAADACVMDSAGDCVCEKRCSFDGQTNICGGACPPAQACLETGDECACAPPPCGFVAGTNTCGGDCPGNAQCTLTPNGCACESPCGPSASGSCGGNCEAATDTCVMNADGTCGCAPLSCGTNPFTGVCGGACPPGTACRSVAGTANACTCEPPPCGLDPASNTCGGDCPQGQSCVDTPNGCQCAASCGLTSTGFCGGACPPGETCNLVPGAVPLCGCAPPAPTNTPAPASTPTPTQPGPPSCGLDPASNTCGGDCPQGQSCVSTPNGCQCQPACGLTSAGVCGGFCPAGSACALIAGATPNCECVSTGPNPNGN